MAEGNPLDERILLVHPDIPGEIVERTRRQFELVHKAQGWREASKKAVKEAEEAAETQTVNDEREEA